LPGFSQAKRQRVEARHGEVDWLVRKIRIVSKSNVTA
jgi:hypothetical protein